MDYFPYTMNLDTNYLPKPQNIMEPQKSCKASGETQIGYEKAHNMENNRLMRETLLEDTIFT